MVGIFHCSHCRIALRSSDGDDVARGAGWGAPRPADVNRNGWPPNQILGTTVEINVCF